MMQQSVYLSSLTPAELRLLIRKEDPRIRTTTGLANGKKLKDRETTGLCLSRAELQFNCVLTSAAP